MAMFGERGEKNDLTYRKEPKGDSDMSKQTDKVLCETPTPGKQGTRIDKWKYDAVRAAILESLPHNGEGLLFEQLPDQVNAHLSEDVREKLGSIPWYTTTVKLDLEVRGEIRRLPDVTPQRLVRVA
jgi:hypothetical protein